MSNYPPGTWEGDPRAPWNAPEAPTCKCGADKEWDDDLEEWVCPDEPTEEDIAYEKAQASAEWQERHGGGL